MTRFETSFVTERGLIIVEVLVKGPRARGRGRFVLDTGAAMTTLVPEFVDTIGYSPRDGLRRTKVHSAISEEDGYLLLVAELTALQITVSSLRVNVFDLGYDGIAGLIGMNFLSGLNCDIRSIERRLLVEKAMC